MSTPGQVFTPPDVAAAMWELGLRHIDHPPRHCVEPSAGDGSLVRAGARALRDLAPDAVIHALELDPTQASPTDLAVEVRWVRADALRLLPGADETPAAFEAWAPPARSETLRAFPEAGEPEWADLVVANPPYLRETGNRSIFRSLRAEYGPVAQDLYRKDSDLHHFFWLLALHWLKPGGVLVFLTPAYFFDAEAAVPLRRTLVEQGRVVSLWRARGAQVFPGVGVEAALTVWKKGASGETAWIERLGEPNRRTIRLDPAGAPWRPTVAQPALHFNEPICRLGECFDVLEGVSTAANRLRTKDVERVEGGSASEGILVLRPNELEKLGLTVDEKARFLRRRVTVDDREEWILLIRDGELLHLDFGRAPVTKLERHLVRFRSVLEQRAEIVRNPSRSWYAVAWPRSSWDVPGTIVTPKWSQAPAFSVLEKGYVPMTDHRALIPRTERAGGASAQLLEWLNSEPIAQWCSGNLKRKGKLCEFYGKALLDLPIPERLVV